MDWKYWEGKRIFVQLKSGSVYSGKVVEVDTNSPPLVFIILIDKFGTRVIINNSEISKVVDEESDDGKH